MTADYRPRPLAVVRTADGTTVEVYPPPSTRPTSPPAASSPRGWVVDGCHVIDLASRRRSAA